MNYKYAQLERNKVTQIVDTEYPMEDSDDAEWIEVSHANPAPQMGWIYDRALGLFGPMTEASIILSEAKNAARISMDMAAGKARTRYITDIPGQSEIYREKYEQAIDFLSSIGTVRYADFPLLEVESKVLDIPMKDIAETVIKRRSNWITKLSAIESLRLSGKYNLENCTTLHEVGKLKAHIMHKLNELK